MYRVFATFLVVLAAGTGLVYYITSDDSSRSGRRGVVLESAGPRAPAPAVAELNEPRPTVAPAAETNRTVSAPAAPEVASVSVPLPVVPSTRSGNRLVIGRISSNVRKHWPRLEAMANYLAAELADQGISGIDVVMVDTLDEMRELFRSGQVDILSETAFSAIELAQDGAAEMLMREWKSGVATYNTVIFARRDSGIRGLEDLVGRNVVFEDRSSTSGYLMPRADMARAGFDLIELDAAQTRPPQGAIGFNFAEDEGTVVSRVMRGFAAAGALSNLDWEDEDEVGASERSDLVVIHETAPVIRSIVLVRNSLDPAIKSRLATILEQMDESDAGTETLREYWKTAQFDRIEGPALDSLLTARVLHETFRSF